MEQQEWSLTPEGCEIATGGSHEAKVFNAVPSEGGISQVALNAMGQFVKIGFARAMKNQWISLDKRAGPDGPQVFRKVPQIQDTVADQLRAIRDAKAETLPHETLIELRHRKLATIGCVCCEAPCMGVRARLIACGSFVQHQQALLHSERPGLREDHPEARS